MKKHGSLIIIVILIISVTIQNGNAQEEYVSEVIGMSETDVSVRIHPKTGNEYVCIRAVNEEEPRYSFQTFGKRYSRPDYAMLSNDERAGHISYDGPVSDRTKVYVLAASLAASGIAAGALAHVGAAGAAGSACAVSAGSTGGAAYATAGAVLGSASIATPLVMSQPDNGQDDFIHESRVRVLN